ncbi:MAG: hypothetical protein ACR2OX_01095, partial [Methyloligellaceae bacterium]
MAEQKQTWFERHTILTAIFLWAGLFAAILAGVEWALTPPDGRYAANTLSSSPAPDRHLRMREWKRDTDYNFPPPKERFKFPGGQVKDLYRLRTDGEAFIEPAIRHKNADLT